MMINCSSLRKPWKPFKNKLKATTYSEKIDLIENNSDSLKQTFKLKYILMTKNELHNQAMEIEQLEHHILTIDYTRMESGMKEKITTYKYVTTWMKCKRKHKSIINMQCI